MYIIIFRVSYEQKKIKDFETHKAMDLVVNGYKVGTYYIDFVVHHLDGTTEYLETKGLKTAVWVLKWKILEAMTHDDPKIRMTLVQQKKFNMRRIKTVDKLLIP